MEKFNPLPGTYKTNDFQTEFSKEIRRVIGIDPGLANTGWGVVDYCSGKYRLVSYGIITTSAKEIHSKRLLHIYDELTKVIREFTPSEAGMEKLFFAKNVTSALWVAEAKGVVSLCIAQNGIPLEEFSPNKIKQSVTGTASADKKLVEQYVKILLSLKIEPKPDHAADALACAITKLHCS